MAVFQAAELEVLTGGSWPVGRPVQIRGFHFDTRQIESGHCFVALASEARDGHDFVPEAWSKGASCALTSRVLDAKLPQLVVPDPLSAMGAIAAEIRSRFSKPVLGITGSCGKTSTKEMLRLLLGQAQTHATAGNWNNRIGVPMTLFALDPERHRYAVIEAGINQPGEMALLGAMIRPDLTILTNIGPAHLERLGSLEGIAAEKSELAASGGPVVLPASALQYPAFARMAERCVALRFADERVPVEVGRVIDCTIERVQGGCASEFLLEGQHYLLRSSSPGMAQNAALAIVAAREMGVPETLLAERLQQWTPEGKRGRVVSGEGYYYYIDCYNANPASMLDALEAFEVSAPAELPRCYLLGAMNELGPQAETFHRSVGSKLRLRMEDAAFFVGPRDLTAAYREGALSAGASPGQVDCAENVAAIQSMVADFHGALFLKGSRAYSLEQVLPEAVARS